MANILGLPKPDNLISIIAKIFELLTVVRSKGVKEHRDNEHI